MSRPEAVVRALQVLEVREELDKTEVEVDSGESALVREMCNVSKMTVLYFILGGH